jgi:hypothetical protein
MLVDARVGRFDDRLLSNEWSNVQGVSKDSLFPREWTSMAIHHPLPTSNVNQRLRKCLEGVSQGQSISKKEDHDRSCRHDL